MSVTGAMQHHLQIEKLNAHFVPNGVEAPLVLAVRGFSATMTKDGLAHVVSALVPEEQIDLRIVSVSEQQGCRIQVQARRLGLSPSIKLSLSASTTLPGGILINVDPSSRWSLVDRVMLGIALHNLDKIAAKETEVKRLAPGAYQLDLQGLIRDRILESSAPVRWDSRLESIEASSNQIRVTFTSFVDGDGTES